MKLRVENLARIKEAEVEIKNLTLFVGQNSTHKSYLAHVVYEVFKNTHRVLNLPLSKSTLFTAPIIENLQKNSALNLRHLVDILKVSSPSNQFSFGIGHEAILYFDKNDNMFQKILFSIHEEIVKSICLSVNQSFNTSQHILQTLQIESNVVVQILKQSQMKLSFFLQDNNQDIEYILNILIRNIYFRTVERVNSEESIYFPASRSGYVLTLEALYSGMFTNSVRGNTKSSKLTNPTIDFIENFHNIKNTKALNYSDENREKLVNFLNNNIIKGKIIDSKNEFDYSEYSLSVENSKIDLHLVSSATLETLPFIIFLKNIKDISKTFFVIEEPEAHLHPKAQVQMAKFIVMLSKTGAKVLVTTHSDYIINEINNSIKLSSIDATNEFAMKKESVSTYLFKNEAKQTVVHSLAIDKFGIANDNFDEVLDELLERSSELSEKIVDAN